MAVRTRAAEIGNRWVLTAATAIDFASATAVSTQAMQREAPWSFRAWPTLRLLHCSADDLEIDCHELPN